MRKNITGIDHVVVLVHDLDRAADVYARMGFRLTPRGYHTLGSQNHCIMFGEDYIELLAVPKPHPAMQYFTDFLATGEGLGAIALATQDASSAHAELAADGVDADAPLDFSRPVDDLGDAKFRIVQLPPDRTPGCRMFLCQHFTRELVWRKGYASHALGVTQIAGIAIVAPEAQGYESVLGTRALPIAEGVKIDTGSAPGRSVRPAWWGPVVTVTPSSPRSGAASSSGGPMCPRCPIRGRNLDFDSFLPTR